MHRFAMLTAGVTFLLIIAGALVVGHDAGLSVPDWPLSFGTWRMPRMVGGIFYEHGHRMIAALVATLTTVLAVWLWRAEQRRWVRVLGVVALLAVIAQAVLGGITVLYFLPIPVLIFHATLAQTFFCIALSLALVTGPTWMAEEAECEDTGFPSFRFLTCAATAAIFIQLILGAARRHKALGLLPHIIWAGVVSILIFWVVLSGLTRLPRSQKAIRTLAHLTGVLLIAQLALGFASYWERTVTQLAPQPDPSMIQATTAHVATGAALLGASLLTTLLAFRRLRSASEALSYSAQKTLA